MPPFVPYLPAVNASLNTVATALLVAGYVLIKQRKEAAHRRAMMAAFGTSVAFLASYLTYHYFLSRYTAAGHVPFAGPDSVRPVYYAILFSHIVLAATVPFLAGITIYFGYRNRREAHRRLAVWTFPIWLYVSITGVVIYIMLYHLYPGPMPADKMEEANALRLPVDDASYAFVSSKTIYADAKADS